MIKIEHIQAAGFEAAIRGARNPMNSWAISDSVFCDEFGCGPCRHDCVEVPKWNNTDIDFCIGQRDLKLMRSLYAAGTEHRKFMRQIFVSMDITAPFYWWKQFDTYKVGTTSNSCSTMHKLTAKEFELSDFSVEHLDPHSLEWMKQWINLLNANLYSYQKRRDKETWYQLVQMLPESYNQKRTITMNYEVAATMIRQRHGHKLDEWAELARVLLEKLPYLKEIMED